VLAINLVVQPLKVKHRGERSIKRLKAGAKEGWAENSSRGRHYPPARIGGRNGRGLLLLPRQSGGKERETMCVKTMWLTSACHSPIDPTREESVPSPYCSDRARPALSESRGQRRTINGEGEQVSYKARNPRSSSRASSNRVKHPYPR